MASSIAVRLAIAAGLLGGAATMCIAQRGYTPPPPQLTTLPPCPLPKDAKDAKKIAKRKDCDPTNKPEPPASAIAAHATGSAADKFPYPGEAPANPASAPAAKAFPYPGESGGQQDADTTLKPPDSAAKQYPYLGEPGSGPTPDVPHDPAAEKKAVETPAGKAFPYPGEHGSDAAPPATPEAGASSSSPENSSSSSSSDSAAKGASSDDDDDDAKPKHNDKGSEGKRNKKTVKPQTDDERVDEDLSIARFYGQSGNFMGSYLRAKDAVKTQPDFAEAHFVLGEAAKRLHKQDEAKAEFTEYLKLSPDGERARAAEKALEELR